MATVIPYITELQLDIDVINQIIDEYAFLSWNHWELIKDVTMSSERFSDYWAGVVTEEFKDKIPNLNVTEVFQLPKINNYRMKIRDTWKYGAKIGIFETP